jgi:hypothetical protein
MEAERGDGARPNRESCKDMGETLLAFAAQRLAVHGRAYQWLAAAQHAVSCHQE